MDGQPLSNATVTFIPPEKTTKEEITATGVTNAEGLYELSIFVGQRVSGALPGKYKVRISRSVLADGTVVDLSTGKPPPMPGRESLPPKYSDILSTELNAEVPNQGGSQDFELTSK
ncbi:MAG: carboxypeptidase-like regulatory domain-containing protein [Planctomycetota bacterium]|nr:carboxypeptidase-like regulatory domain-containing protein [Planctomycetota bacterium]MDA1213173.1 carboxypeptidase-like regulatory domain-containing protein [Planctomycetota bacterium]